VRDPEALVTRTRALHAGHADIAELGLHQVGAVRWAGQPGLQRVVEVGLAMPDWAGLPLDAGTAKVLADGCKILVDDGTVAAALESLGRPVTNWEPVR